MVKRQNKLQILILSALCIGFLWTMAGCGHESTDGPLTGTEETNSDQELKGNKILWDGKVYQYNDHLSNFLFMGVDKSELVDTSVGSADAGQTDALFLVSWDRVTHNVTVITIPRDTMTTINVYGRDGTDMGPVEQQINLAYGFGDGKHKSCQLTKDAVSALFYRIPILGYCATTLDALEEMSAILGAVTVTVPNDSLAAKDSSMTAGAQVEITTDNIELFVRYRDIEQTNSALHRTERQNAFLKACYAKVMEQFDTDPGIVTRLYTGLEQYMVTNMGNDQFVKIMESLAEGGTVTQWTVPGEGVATDIFDEYHVDEDAFFDLILESFFEEED